MAGPTDLRANRRAARTSGFCGVATWHPSLRREQVAGQSLLPLRLGLDEGLCLDEKAVFIICGKPDGPTADQQNPTYPCQQQRLLIVVPRNPVLHFPPLRVTADGVIKLHEERIDEN